MDTPCPRCRTSDRVRPVTSEDKSALGIFLLGGLLSFLLHRDSHRNRLFCERCAVVFSPKRPAASPAAIALIVVMAGVAFYGAWRMTQP